MKRVGDGVPPEALCETAGISPSNSKKWKKGVMIELEGGGGLVSVANEDGTFTHTLNTRSCMELERSSS
jgi:hypothetical protein